MRRKEAFDFKQFQVRHDLCTMKVGTDAVLLGAWVNIENARRILDVGSGSGVIALMLAQRTSPGTQLVGVEPMVADVNQSRENILASPWSNRISVVHTHLQNFQPSETYDLIVSNPPFFSNSQLPPSEKRKNVRHTETLTHEELLVHTKRLLSPEGRFAVVLPVVEGEQFKREAAFAGFFLQRALAFFSRDRKPQERFLFEFARHPVATTLEKLTLYEGESDSWTADYKNLMRDFYLHISLEKH